MAKKRKTLEQKKQAELRHLATQPEQTISTSPVYSLRDFSTSTVTKLSAKSPQQMRSNNSTASIVYTYAFSDLRKTLFTTLAIVIAQIVLFFIVNK